MAAPAKSVAHKRFFFIKSAVEKGKNIFFGGIENLCATIYVDTQRNAGLCLAQVSYEINE